MAVPNAKIYWEATGEPGGLPASPSITVRAQRARCGRTTRTLATPEPRIWPRAEWTTSGN